MKLRTTFAILTAAAAATAALSTEAMAVPASESKSGGEVVIFGDSIFANPTDREVAQFLILKDEKISAIPGAKAIIGGDPNWTPTDCLHGHKTVANELAQVSGRTVHDYSCAGAMGVVAQDGVRNFTQQIDLAQAEGNLDASTKTVLLQFGFNDYRDDSMKTNAGDRTYIDGMKEKIARIKQLAPNADVRMMSYPTLSDSNKMVCPVRIVANNPVPLRAPLETVTTGEQLTEDRDKVIAAETGTPIIDLKGRTKDLHTCAGDSERWVAGIIDVPVKHQLFMHLTDRGVDGTAAFINDEIS